VIEIIAENKPNFLQNELNSPSSKINEETMKNLNFGSFQCKPIEGLWSRFLCWRGNHRKHM
jgi:hypothetical protein